LLVESKRLAIEYNGLMFHSRGTSEYSMFNNPNRKCSHLEKTKSVEALGFQLLHVFEDEFINSKKRRIWEVIIKDLIKPENISEFKVKELTEAESCDFVTNNHLTPPAKSDIHLGTYSNDELISVMNFKQNGVGWLITEHAYKRSGTNTFKELVASFTELHTGTLTLELNRRWNTEEHACVDCGFVLEEVQEPRSYYFKQTELNLISEQAFKSERKLESTPEEVFELGYREIKDSGRLIFKRNTVNTN